MPAAVTQAMRLFGGPETLERAQSVAARPESEAALERLSSISKELHALGFGDRIQFDLGEVRDFDYYTGMIFELHAPGTGLELGGGGRYDSLLTKFGVPHPAVGFSLSLDRLAHKVDEARLSPERPSKSIALAKEPTRALGEAMERRRKGEKVRLG